MQGSLRSGAGYQNQEDEGGERDDMVDAADVAAAVRVKKGLGTQLKLLGQVKDIGVDKWKKKLELIAHNDNWPKYLASLSEPQPPQDEETKEHAEMRKSFYTLIHSTVEGKEALLQGIALGDGNAAFKAIYRSYYRATTGGYHAATNKFHNCAMEKEGVNLTDFAALVTQRSDVFEAAGGQPTELDKTTVLLAGLLPEFSLQGTAQDEDPGEDGRCGNRSHIQAGSLGARRLRGGRRLVRADKGRRKRPCSNFLNV
jgi:hypothetical protein